MKLRTESRFLVVQMKLKSKSLLSVVQLFVAMKLRTKSWFSVMQSFIVAMKV